MTTCNKYVCPVFTMLMYRNDLISYCRTVDTEGKADDSESLEKETKLLEVPGTKLVCYSSYTEDVPMKVGVLSINFYQGSLRNLKKKFTIPWC